MILLSVSMACMSLPAFAYNEQHQSQQLHQPPGHVKHTAHAASQHAKHVKKVTLLKPHQAWKVGHPMPASYRAKAYRVADYRTYHLSRPAKNQHWYRVNGDYVLVNVITHSILQIISGR